MEAFQYFFSYTRKDSAFVLRLAQELREVGINLWLDQLDILGGQRWDRAVEAALQTCQGMITVLSPDALASHNAMDEVSYALEERKIVIPLLLHSCTIPFRLRRVQYIDFTADYQTGFAQLLRALCIDQPSPPRAPAVPEDIVVQDETVPSQETPREVPTREQLPRRADPPEPASAVPEETLETGGAALIQPPLGQASHRDGRPFDAVSQQEEAAPPPVREKDRPEVHRHTTGDTRVIPGLSRRLKRHLVLVGGVLLCGLVTVLYLVLSGRTPEPQPQPEPQSARTTEGTQPASSLTNSLGMQFALIPAGEFQMGSDGNEEDERPVHRVRISEPFYLGKYEVTQAQWKAVMGTNPSRFKGNPNRPVESVSWEDVQEFITRLNQQEGWEVCRLPTEAQWEYAARAGTTTDRYENDVDAIAWYDGNSGKETHEVGQKRPNAWGVYDMLGNVWEWCHDGNRTYTAAPAVDPIGPTGAGADRVIRGGSWNFSAQDVRAAYRYWFDPGNRGVNVGFRCASSGPSK